MAKNCLLYCLLLTVTTTYAQTPAYKNPNLPVNKRVADLLGRMTVEEKIAQLQTNHANIRTLTEAILANPAKMDSIYGRGLGMINPAFDASKEQVISRRNGLQQYLKTKTRLGIPVIFIDEAHHGLLAREATVFPHGIGLSCSWDTALLRKVYNYIAHQSAIRGTNLVLTPVVDVCRDPRWGRTGETLGEDPFLTGSLGSAMVQGFQGSRDGSIAPGHVAATLKHFAGYGQTEGGVNQAPANYSLRTFREAHLESFRLCIQNAKPAAIMASYNEIDGIPAHANSWLLRNVLRGEWGFKGVVVSDWYGVDQLWNKHFIAANEPAAALKAFKAGVTLDLPNGRNYSHLGQWIKDKQLTMAELDSAVVAVLRLKFGMGLFEQGPISADKVRESLADPEGGHLALQAAEESMVLLKNDNNLLPLKKDQYKRSR
ncbi:glycoside hydrolase family 3 protein [Paraflavitalea speifideaquila]|uniref:glycoside hydrolase family 3 protein n=1 Tax=Paraflavitalea speifideaquila TaxID=3076558 RepID=UPI0028E1D868|nr:glycoside hydrolase family 3 protein [Paraflavitalea speifideiaquila]